MKPKRNGTVDAIAKYFGLRVIRVRQTLPAPTCGLLDPSCEPRFILVNGDLPLGEQEFTIAHEIAHYVLHHNRPRREHSNWFLNRRWKLRPLAEVSRRTKRAASFIFNKEREVDTWAFCVLLQMGAIDTLMAHLDRYPKKAAFFYGIILPLVIVKGIVRRIRTATESLWSRFCLS